MKLYFDFGLVISSLRLWFGLVVCLLRSESWKFEVLLMNNHNVICMLTFFVFLKGIQEKMV